MVKNEGDCQSDTLELRDDAPTIFLGPRIEDMDEEDVPPFYVSLYIHDMILHNAMLDSGASHNLMPRVVVETLGLEITRPYKDLFSFDSRKVRCLELIKDMVVTLAQIPSKSIIMDVVVADIPLILVCYYQGHGLQSLRESYKWTCTMQPFLYLDNTKDCTE